MPFTAEVIPLSSAAYTAEELAALDAIYDAPDGSGIPAYMEDLLYIQPKEGGHLVPLDINHGQWKLIKAIQAQWAAGKPVRIIVLKARQIGFSTIIQAFCTWYTTRRRNVRSLAIAHEGKGTKNMFDMFTRYVDNLRPEFRTAEAARNTNLNFIKFDNPQKGKGAAPGMQSQYDCETAEDPEAGRSGTFQFIHASEVAFWPYSKTFTALLQTIANKAGTVLILESTANGASGNFYEIWKAAERGENDYIAIFVGWWEHPDYELPASGEQTEIFARVQAALAANETPAVADLNTLTMDEEEMQLAALYPVTWGKLLWRRWAIANLCEGDIDKFHQEYPSNADEAFLTSGRPWFDAQAVIRRKEELRQAEAAQRYRIDEVASEAAKHPVLEEDPFGELWVWNEPAKGRKYALGADVAQGEKDGDADAAYVIDVETMDHMAELHGHFDTDTYGRKLHWLGLWYNRALLGVENNNMGSATVQTLEKYTQYPNLYGDGWPHRHKVRTYGWNTNQKTRPIILGKIRQAFREGLWQPCSLGWCDEALSFKQNEKGRPEGEGSAHDDRILGSAIALEMRELVAAQSGHRLRDVVNLGGKGPDRPRLRVVPKHPRW